MTNKEKRTDFFENCYGGDLNSVAQILADNPDAIIWDDGEDNALTQTVLGANEITNLGLIAGADDAKVIAPYLAIITALINAGIDLNWQRHASKTTALHLAMEHPSGSDYGVSRSTIITMLVRAGAKPDLPNGRGDTAADYAETRGDGRTEAIKEGQRLRAEDNAMATAAAGLDAQQSVIIQTRQQKLYAIAARSNLRLGG